MRAVDIIEKKRDGESLNEEEIRFFIDGFTNGSIPDYQASAWAMAVLLNGMTAEETTYLTLAMVDSGETLDLSDIVELTVDKHSTGGVGDKTTIVAAPVVRACGLPVAKMSGRGLGFSGGTLDKMESIPGYRCDLSSDEFRSQLGEIGIVLTGQAADLAPADGKLYELRDVTGTVQSQALIASSVMSKKIASGANGIVLDVKVGNGAFMQELEEGRALAELMVAIGHRAGSKTIALISDMNQPLGKAVGNALELKEAIETLKGGGPEDFREHCVEVADYMLVLSGIAGDKKEARKMTTGVIEDGTALDYLKKLVAAQGGDPSYVDDPGKLPAAKYVETIKAPRAGYLAKIHARTIGEMAVLLGAGREKKGAPIDYAVGLEILHNVGDRLDEGDPLFIVHYDDEEKFQEALPHLIAAHGWSDEPVDPLPLFYGVVEERNKKKRPCSHGLFCV